MKRTVWKESSRSSGGPAWFILGFIFIAIICFLSNGCASPSSVKTHPGKSLSLPGLIEEVREISHFITFRAPPDGVEVVAIDTISGKEILPMGTTPVRILVLRKKLIFLDGKVSDVQDIRPIANALTYGKDIMGGVEFQFKLRKYGFSDYMVIERIPFLMGDSTKTIEIKMEKANDR